jgi:hypothetical protein
MAKVVWLAAAHSIERVEILAVIYGARLLPEDLRNR